MEKKNKIICFLLFLACAGLIFFASRSLFWPHPLKDSPNVLIITLDTTRADHLGCYGYDKIKTPHIDSVAREGVLFEEAFSVQPVTLPSHCSIFTGVYPFHHGVRENGSYKLGEKYLTLAEILEEKGYFTAAFVSSYTLDKQFGLNQGFSLYNDHLSKPGQNGGIPVERQAADVSLHASKWLDTNKKELEKRPFFLWIHYFDPHMIYEPPAPYREKYADPYDGEIAYMDEWIGYVFNKLKLSGLWDNTIALIVADHGESLDEHREMTHGIFIYRSTTHVPLILKYPNASHGGERITQRVSVVDIMPTVLDMLHINTDEIFDGKSLIPLIEKKSFDNKRPIYIETFYPRNYNWSDIKGIRKGNYFFIDAPRPELYLDNEFDNLINLYPGMAVDMKHTITTMLAGTSESIAEHVPVDEETTEKLEALGYFLTGGQKTMDEGTNIIRPDPKDKIELYNVYQMAHQMIIKDQYKQAAKLLDKIIEQEPDNTEFLMALGEALIGQKNYEAAEKHLLHTLSITMKTANCHYLLGLCYEKWGKPDKALQAYEEALALDQKHFLTLFRLGLLHLRAGKLKEAEQTFLKAKRISPSDALTLNNLGYIAILARNDLNEGIELIERALKIDSGNPSILGCLGWAYYKAKNYKKAATHLEAALALVPDKMLFIEQLKIVYETLGDYDKMKVMQNREKLLDSKEKTATFPVKESGVYEK